jgi:hypothetical protein
MNRQLGLAAITCLFFLSSCYVSTNVKVQNRNLPADFSPPVLVVTLQQKTGLAPGHKALLERNAVDALTKKGINAVALHEAAGEDNPSSADKLLLSKDYKALLKIVIESWGSKTETLQEPVPTSVGNFDPGPDPGSSFRRPQAIDEGETVAGPESSYKEVVIAGYLTDLASNRLIWSARANARPAVVGRSFLYHRFNRNLEYNELAERCLNKLAQELKRVWPKESAKSLN